MQLGNRTNLGEAGAIGRAATAKGADAFAVNVLPVIASIKAAGGDELSARRVETARGGAWTAMQVKRMMERAA